MNCFSQKAPLVSPEGYELVHWWIKNKVVNTIASIFQWEVGAVLTCNEVKEWYFWSRKHCVYKISDLVDSEWNNLVEENAKLLLLKWFQIWLTSSENIHFINQEKAERNVFCYISEANVHIKITKDSIKSDIIENWRICVNQELLEAYIKKWYIAKHELNEWVERYIYKIALDAVEKIQLPLFTKIKNWKKIFLHDYHDLVRDLSSEYQNCLAYAITKWWIEGKELKIVTDALRFWWDTLDYFIRRFYNDSLREDILSKISVS